MAANVLNSRQAVEASVHVVRAFVKLRQWMGTQREFVAKLAELEQRIGSHDEAIGEIIAAIHELMDPPAERRRERIGFTVRPREDRRKDRHKDRHNNRHMAL